MCLSTSSHLSSSTSKHIMGKKICNQFSVSICFLVIGFLTQNLVIPVMARTNFQDKKNYYSPDPHPPSGSHGTPSHGTPPTHGGGGGYGGTPPSHGGGGHSGSPPSHTTPSNPSPGNCGNPPSSVPTPPSGGGGYYPSPPTSGGSSPPTPINPPYVPTPSTPTTPPYVPTPSTPTTPPDVPTPSTPTPTTPYVPSPPFIPDPNSPFTCNYWRNHPGIVWGLLGWWGTVGSAFGVSTIPGYGASMSLQQALSNTRSDGYGTLYREGTASLLNSMVSNRFAFTTKQVRDGFMSALRSNKAAGAQGRLFKMANEGKLKPTT